MNHINVLEADAASATEVTTTAERRSELVVKYYTYCDGIRREDRGGQCARMDEQLFWDMVEERFCKENGCTREDLALAFEEERPGL